MAVIPLINIKFKERKRRKTNGYVSKKFKYQV